MANAKKQAELRKDIEMAKDNLANLRVPTGEGKAFDIDRQLELPNDAVLAIAKYILESDQKSIDSGTF